MIVRFCLYGVLKNLRFADPFLVLFLLDLGYSLTAIGSALGAQHLMTSTLEVPLGVAADRFGRRKSLAGCFLAYAAAFFTYAGLGKDQYLGLALALATFGLGEALRTGSHKAIILDYLDGRGESHRTTELIGLTRSYSRLASGAAALGGGVMLYSTHSYPLLFQASALAALGGFILMLSYPAALEGEQQRDQGSALPRLSFGQRVRQLTRDRQVLHLGLQSTLFESQLKLVRKVYIQPLIKQALAGAGLPLMGLGAIAVGAVELTQDIIGFSGARLAVGFERRSGNRTRALTLAYRGALVGVVGICALSHFELAWLGIALAVLLSLMQNARRPVFVASFNEAMDKPQRATTLSLESLARTVTLAVVLPLAGWLGDSFGLWAAFVPMALLLLGGLAIPIAPDSAPQDAAISAMGPSAPGS